MCIFLKKECKKITIIIHVLQYIYMYFVISQIFYDVMHIPISYPQLYTCTCICIRYRYMEVK